MRIEAANKAAETAEHKIKIAFDYAVNVDGFSKKEAKKILYERLDYSPQWIGQFLPDDAKDMSKSRPDQSHRKIAKSYIALENLSKSLDLPKDTKKEKTIQIPYKESKLVAMIIPSDKVRNFYSDLQRIKDRAEKHGLRIYADATVEVLHL